MSNEQETKLENLKITKVDLVDEGANPEANIALFKHKDGKVVEPPVQQEDLLRKVTNAVKKALGMEIGEKENDGDFTDTFNQKISTRNIQSEMWRAIDAIQESLLAIMNDGSLDQDAKRQNMSESIDQFAEFMKRATDSWVQGRTISIIEKNKPNYPGRLENIELGIEQLSIIAKSLKTVANEDKAKNVEKTEGEAEEETLMRFDIDETKLTDAEAAELAKLIEKAQPEGEANDEAKKEAPEDTEKSAKTEKRRDLAIDGELAELRKFKEDHEKAQMIAKAKEYEILGTNTEELAERLAKVRSVDKDAYDAMIKTLDNQKAATEKGGLFGEIGHVGRGQICKSFNKVNTIAKSYMEKDPSLTRQQAITKAFENNPELIDEYENNR